MDAPEEPEEVEVEVDDASSGQSAGGTAATPFPRTGSSSRPSAFSAGKVLSLTFSVLFRNPVFYLVLSTIACLPGIIAACNSTDPRKGNSTLIADTFISVIFMSAITYGVYRDLTGERANLAEALRRGLSRYFSLIGITLIYGICLMFVGIGAVILEWAGVVFGGILIIYGGCVYSIVTPACVVEKLGPVRSMDRSSTLTKGRRGSIFGLFLIYFLGAGLLELTMEKIFPARFNHTGVNIAETAAKPFFTAFMQVLIAVLYYQLRADREGVSVDKLARVFD